MTTRKHDAAAGQASELRAIMDTAVHAIVTVDERGVIPGAGSGGPADQLADAGAAPVSPPAVRVRRMAKGLAGDRRGG